MVLVPVVAPPHARNLLDGMSARLELAFPLCASARLYCRLTELIEAWRWRSVSLYFSPLGVHKHAIGLSWQF
jgi:hypothetical protein